MTKVNAFYCRKCSTLMYSRARHDFRRCPCGDLTVDGGLDYARVLYKLSVPPAVEFEIDETERQLYDDWNHRVDKLGMILGYEYKNDTKVI